MEKRTSASERIGRNVRRIRQSRGETLAQLSAALDALGWPLSVGKLSKIELGDRGVDADDLEMLATVLGVRVTQLLADDEAVANRIARLMDQIGQLQPELRAATARATDLMMQVGELVEVVEDERRQHPEVFNRLVRHPTTYDTALAVGLIKEDWEGIK